MLKNIFVLAALLFGFQSTWAAPLVDEDLTAEMQQELEAMDEELALDGDDQLFLDQTKPQDAIVWGKAESLKPVKKASASPADGTQPKPGTLPKSL